MPNQPENGTPAVDTGAVDSAPATNTSLLLDAASTTTTAARRAGDAGNQLTKLAEFISTHIDAGTSHLTQQMIIDLRTETEAVCARLYRALMDAEHAEDCIRALAADDTPSRTFAENSPNTTVPADQRAQASPRYPSQKVRRIAEAWQGVTDARPEVVALLLDTHPRGGPFVHANGEPFHGRRTRPGDECDWRRAYGRQHGDSEAFPLARQHHPPWVADWLGVQPGQHAHSAN